MLREMAKDELLEKMRRERELWDALLAQVQPELVDKPVLHDGWSVKDVVAHVAYYERWILGWLQDVAKGKAPTPSYRDELDVDRRNAWIYEENKDRPLDILLRESRDAFERLVQLVEGLDERDLIDPHRNDRFVLPLWKESLPLWECIEGDTFGHYLEHAPTIRACLESAQARRA